MKLYPIILFTYNRPWHTEQVLRALKKNELADQSHLIVYVDGPKANATHEQIGKIEEVRRVVKQEQWCGSVEYHIAEQNIGCRNSIIQGITEVLNRYEAAIILEDDIVTSPYFLRFMNTCLDYYRNYKSVFSVSGHNLPENKFQLPPDYDYDVFVSLRLLNWGWATWSDRWQQVNWDKTEIPIFMKNDQFKSAFNRSGDDMSKMLLEEYDRKSDAWDIQFAWHHFSNHGVSIVPRHSYINNIGADGSGTHVGAVEGLGNDISLAIKEPRLLNVIYEDTRIINAFYNVFCATKRPLWKKIINRLSRMLGGKNVFVIKKKIYA